MKFENLNLSPSILKALKELNYQTVSPIQEKTIPAILSGHDLMGCAQTGTGKTCAFAVPIINKLLSKRICFQKRIIKALILAPTRELAIQIFNNFRVYAKYNPIRSCVIYGGAGYTPQIQALSRGADILVATPGRLNDLILKGYVDISGVDFLVLDEADIMLDMGFINEVKKIIDILPKKRQTLMFSATMSNNIQNFGNSILKNPVKIIVSPPSTTVDSIQQFVYMVDKNDKANFLLRLIKNLNIQFAIIFTRTKAKSDKVADWLKKMNILAKSIHGDKPQWERKNILKNFKEGKIKILVATDIAARGLDIKGISHVINYDIPRDGETYVHRIGRTGRAGKSGISITFCENSERIFLASIEKTINKKIKIVNKINIDKNQPSKINLNLAKNSNHIKKSQSQKHKNNNDKLTLDENFQTNIKLISRLKINKNISNKNQDKAKSFDEWLIFNSKKTSNSKDISQQSKVVNQNNFSNSKNEIFDFALRKSREK